MRPLLLFASSTIALVAQTAQVTGRVTDSLDALVVRVLLRSFEMT